MTLSARCNQEFIGVTSGSLKGLIARMSEEFGDKPKVIATGGLAPLFAKATNVIEAIDLDLTTRGLRYISFLNRGS